MMSRLTDLLLLIYVPPCQICLLSISQNFSKKYLSQDCLHFLQPQSTETDKSFYFQWQSWLFRPWWLFWRKEMYQPLLWRQEILWGPGGDDMQQGSILQGISSVLINTEKSHQSTLSVNQLSPLIKYLHQSTFFLKWLSSSLHLSS